MMVPLLRKDDLCCQCQRPAAKVLMTTGDYMGMALPVAAALCSECYARKDRDELLGIYVERIFKLGKIL
jgi:hypothetical protein